MRGYQMIRLIVVMLICVCSWPSHAAHRLIATDDDGTQYYLDLSTRINKSPVVLVEVLMTSDKPDFTEGGVVFLSQVRETEYDCGRKMRRWRDVRMFSGQSGKGIMVASYQSSDKWFPLKSGSIGDKLLSAACSGLK